jgi:hypothetical protein
MTTTVYRNTILGFSGSWGSGLATLIFEEGLQVPADNGPLGRALIGAFDAASPGHSIDNRKIAGQEIVWFYDDFGLILAGFIVYADWLEDGRPELDYGPNEIEITEEGDVILADVEVTL